MHDCDIMRTLGEKSTAAVFLVQHFRHAERDAVCFASLENFCSWTVFFCSLPHELSKFAKLIARVQYRAFFFHNWWRRSSCMLPAGSIFLSSIAFFFFVAPYAFSCHCFIVFLSVVVFYSLLCIDSVSCLMKSLHCELWLWVQLFLLFSHLV